MKIGVTNLCSILEQTSKGNIPSWCFFRDGEERAVGEIYRAPEVSALGRDFYTSQDLEKFYADLEEKIFPKSTTR
jgi:hypothetical protein